MNPAEFKASLEADAPPMELSPALQALWCEAKGDWHEAHRLAQAQDDAIGAWVHAYLHRGRGRRQERRLLVSPCRQAPFLGSVTRRMGGDHHGALVTA